ncbi:CoA transferase [Paracoccus sp. MC1862]|uniref:CoA transferase n=1 Tax=Paracoccus sp. MC1862 TaxID=2760307 RepID=UPI001601785D|nr:CoA transferase [Paracoccus sp. MC1862]MBB1497124.1 CoA transferase [Paracoccus sp. MC1862]QQO44479.1 CoA transferase [Paracoccus sp. MC1862]
MFDLPLSGLTAVCMATNVPGPAAAAILAGQGMEVIKIEPPSGDLTALAMPQWYAELNRAAKIETVDLRSDQGQARFRALLKGADLLISSHRRAALGRLGITVPALAAVNPRLAWVEIVGDEDAPDLPGHDLTYQATAGLLDGRMPRAVIADMAGAERAASAATTLLLGRERGRPQRHAVIGLRQAAERFAAPVRLGFTVNGGLLSGASPDYAIHALRDGLVACAALEPHFSARLAEVAGGDIPGFFAGLTIKECRALARERDLPLEPFRA